MSNLGMSALHRQNKSQQYSLQASDHGTGASQYVTLLVIENLSDHEPALAAAVPRAPLCSLGQPWQLSWHFVFGHLLSVVS